MAVTPEEFIDVLKMQPATDYIKTLIPTGGAGGGTVDESLFMKEKGVIADIADVVETGIYYGTNVTNTPASGDVMVMGSRDIHGNMCCFLMDSKMDLYLGGTPSSGTTNWTKMLKGGDNVIIGDRTGEAQLTLDAKTGDASHVVFKRNGTTLSSIGATSASNNEDLIIEQRAAADVRFTLPADQHIVAKIGTVFHTIATDKYLLSNEFAKLIPTVEPTAGGIWNDGGALKIKMV